MKKLLRRFCTWLANRISSQPNPRAVHASLTELYNSILQQPQGTSSLLNTRTGITIPFDATTGRFIIFSDQHKGTGDAADDFAGSRHNYSQALAYYHQQGYTLINMGDSEELWENKPEPVLDHYAAILQQEALFHQAGRQVKLFGNHDLLWFDPLAVQTFLYPVFSASLKVYEGVVLQTVAAGIPLQLFLTHGHQGDLVSDSNAFSKWFVGRIWVPIQRWLNFNVNTPAKDFTLRDRHNQVMYQWAEQRTNTVLITGHTHKPVFESLNHLQRLAIQVRQATEQGHTGRLNELQREIRKKEAEYESKEVAAPTTLIRPAYYNSGCCCFSDGDITGIEIADGMLRLVRWHMGQPDSASERQICEEAPLAHIAAALEKL